MVAGRDHRDDSRLGRRVDRVDDEVTRRRDLRLAEREVDHVHAVGDRRLDTRCDLGRVAVEAEAGGGDRQRLVVPEIGVGRDAGERQRAVGRGVSPAAIPGNVGGVEGAVLGRIEGAFE